MDKGCLKCDMFHVLAADHNDCVLSWLRIIGLVALILATLGGCCYCCGDFEDSELWGTPPQATRQRDAAHVVQRGDEGLALRRRGTRAQTSPLREERKGSYPLMPGYEGIEITEETRGARD